MATIIDGKAVAARDPGSRSPRTSRSSSPNAARRPGWRPCWSATTRASQIYVAGKHRACAEVGIALDRARAARATPPRRSCSRSSSELNADPAVSGIIVQLPLPGAPGRGARHVARSTRRRTSTGSRPTNAGLLVQGRDGLVPATPSGVMELLRAYDTPLEGAHAVVVGSQRPGRQAGRLAAAGRERNRDGLPLAHAGPRRGLPVAPTCWSRRSGARGS